ncbi:Type 1 phosphatases regulator ypi1 [Coemansia sp. BCRC 34301]|nr:Type 1 phosphatases regulator ypi1 [Coemansia sp. BCRC 34301]
MASAVGRARLGGVGGSGTSLASHGSRTVVVGGGEGQAEGESQASASAGVLRLRGDTSRPASASVQWASDTVDNEHLNRKKSKVCCIFRRQRQFGESDSGSGSDSSCGGSGSGGDSPNEYERMPKPRDNKKEKKKSKCHGHN